MAFVLNNVNLEQFCDELKVLTKYTYILAVIDDFLPNCVLLAEVISTKKTREQLQILSLISTHFTP